jgi:hypothetical protein
MLHPWFPRLGMGSERHNHKVSQLALVTDWEFQLQEVTTTLICLKPTVRTW